MSATPLMVNMFFASVLGVAVWQVLSIYKRKLEAKRERQELVERARERAVRTVRTLQSMEDEIMEVEMAVRNSRWQENHDPEFQCAPKQRVVK